MAKREKKAPEGAPAWMTTFADLMSLLLTFFVLLLSFSSMDVKKYKKAVGSLKNAFGVQFEDAFEVDPKAIDPITKSYGKGAKVWEENPFAQIKVAPDIESFCELEKDRLRRDRQELEFLHMELEKQITKAVNLPKGVSLVLDKQELKIRLQQTQIYSQNSTEINRQFSNVLGRMQKVLSASKVQITIATYHDNLRRSQTQRNRWKLSNMRAMNLGLYVEDQYPNIAGGLDYSSLPVESDKDSTNHIDLIVKIQ